MQNKDRIRSLIRGWVRENYGESEANDPSWSIVKLANYLADHFHTLYWEQEMDYLQQDVKAYAEQHKYILSEQQVYDIADEIRNSDWYCSIEPEVIDSYIRQELKEEG